jgi:pheromone alpha factor receptor
MGPITNVCIVILTCIEFSEAHIDLSTWTLTTAACLLPLSTIWAKAADEEEQASLRLSRGSQNSSKVRSGVCSSHFASQCSTTVCSERKGSVAPSGSFNKSTIDTILEHNSAPRSLRDSTEVDLERMGVRVDRSYSVNDQGR